MKRLPYILTIIPLCILLTQTCFTQSRSKIKYDNNGTLLEFLPFVSATTDPDTLQLDLFLKIAHTHLQFVRADTIFKARYEVTIQILDKSDQFVLERIKTGSISHTNFIQRTQNKQFLREKFTFNLPEGLYKLHLELFDMETKIPIRRKTSVELKPFLNQSLTATELIFLGHFDDSKPFTNEEYPRFPAYQTENDSALLAFMYVYTNQYPRAAQVTYALKNYTDEIISIDSIGIQLQHTINPILIPIYSTQSFGKYFLTVKIQSDNDSITQSNSFTILKKSNTKYIHDLSISIDALIYIMSSDEHKELLNASDDQQIKLFESFWKSKDPTPETPENELQEEYYKRVAYVTRHFSYMQGSIDGWKTDRGRIHITFGPPSDIERPQSSGMETTSKYEIWYYRNLHRRFIFRDRMGFGDYKLYRQE